MELSPGKFCSPLPAPAAARLGRQEHGASCPASNSRLQNSNLLSVRQAQWRLSKLPLMRGLLTLRALVSDSWHCQDRECGESHTLPCWETQGPWRPHKPSVGLDNGSNPSSVGRAYTSWQTYQTVRNLGIVVSESLVSAPSPPTPEKKKLIKHSLGVADCYKA